VLPVMGADGPSHSAEAESFVRPIGRGPPETEGRNRRSGAALPGIVGSAKFARAAAMRQQAWPPSCNVGFGAVNVDRSGTPSEIEARCLKG
jgi:hypothetical protein